MITVTLFSRPDSEACKAVKNDLAALQEKFPHQLVEIDIEKDVVLGEIYGSQAPVLQIGPFKLRGAITRQELQIALGAASDRADHLIRLDDEGYQKRIDRGHTVTWVDRLYSWLADHYMAAINTFLFVFLALPFVAPIFMKIGWIVPGKIIYAIYSPFCHQLAFRSWFLFGQQPFYPRALAQLQNVLTYEQAFGQSASNVEAARAFLGSTTLGYKVAICQRDIAIYLSILVFGCAFVLRQRKIRPIPWWVYILVGILPIAVDGFSQLPSLLTGMPVWLPIRESTPFLRFLTGGLFGVCTGWFFYPMIEESMQQTRRFLAGKYAVIRRGQQ